MLFYFQLEMKGKINDQRDFVVSFGQFVASEQFENPSYLRLTDDGRKARINAL